MGQNYVKIENQTNYTWTYCYCYLGSESIIRGYDVLGPWKTKERDPQSPILSNVYIKFGHHSQHECRYNADLVRFYSGIDNPTFTIKEINYDRSQIQLICDRGGPAPTCPNYGKQKEDERQRQEEQRRREEAERRRLEEEQRRKAEEEEKRQRERAAREKRIQEEIEKENRAVNEKLTNASEKFRALQRGLQSHQRQTQILHIVVEDDAAGIQSDEIYEIEKKFEQLLREHAIHEDESMKCCKVQERIRTIQNECQAQYCLAKDWPIWSLSPLQDAFNQETLSLTEQFNLLEAIVQVIQSNSGEEVLHSLGAIAPINEKHGCYLRVVDILFRENKTLAAKLSRILFPELSTIARDYLAQILFTGMWTPSQAFLLVHETTTNNISADDLVRLLHIVQTYQIPPMRTIFALKTDNPVEDLLQHVLEEKDKDLETILLEMKLKNYPENLILLLKNVLQKVRAQLPEHEPFPDLSDNMKTEGVKIIQSIDFSNPDPEKLAYILVGLSIAVQDKTTTFSENKKIEKIEGYFPRMTQLAALLTLLLSRQLGQKGCLLEISTGEGKSCIVAMLAIILAKRGYKVDIVTSSPVLARRDEEEWSKLYDTFNLTHSIIPPKGLDTFKDSRDRDNALKDAYKKDIVYGTVGNFAADILKQEFEKEKTRGDRQFDVVIVDEVDYLTLDSGVQVTFLSHASMGMRHLEQLLAAVWAKVCMCKQIEHAQTEEILWVTRIQAFHDAATSAVMGSARSEHFSPYDILKPGLQLGFYSEDDIKQLELNVGGSGESTGPGLRAILKRLGPFQQRELLTIFEGVLEDSVAFQCYQVKNDKAVELESNFQTDTATKFSLLLLDEGCASEILNEKDLINATVHDLKDRITFSDNCELPSLEDENQNPFLLIPAHLKQYVENRLPVFVENALKAIVMVKDREYMIDSNCPSAEPGNAETGSNNHIYDCIVPVDYKSTGVLEKNKRWGDGLQQFLEMKHQLALSPLSNVTNFMSNFHFFQRYVRGNGVYGVSGTLGDEAETDFLRKNFQTSCFEIPTHRHTKKVEIPIIQVEGGHKPWMQMISDRVKEVTSPKEWAPGQAALVVCEDMKTAQELQVELIEHKAVCSADKITLYTRSDRHTVENRKFDAGDVIIATNLGGRGTDIKISRAVNDSGGLFVILTYFPSNKRVEKQIFGRTARKGNPGMAQMILNQQDLAVAYQGQPIESMRKLRANYEKVRISDMENDELLEVNMREELFGEFCKLLQMLDNRYAKEEKGNVYSTVDLKPFKLTWKNYRQQLDYRPALNALKETWALWLTMHSKDIDEHVNMTDLKADLRRVIEAQTRDLMEGKSNNFYDFIRQAMDRMYLHTHDKKHDYGTLSYWEAAISTDKVFSAVSLYNQAYITVNLGENDYKQKAIDLLEKSKAAINVYIVELKYTMIPCQIAQTAQFELHCKESPNLNKQMETRLSLMKSWNDYIEKSIEKLKELQEENEDAITKDEVVFSLSAEKDHIISNELVGLYDQGLGIVFEVEKKPRFCIDALICAIIGLCQILAGALVCALSLGAASQIGMGLISEGVSDVISGVEGMITNQFSWKDWGISKAISFGMALLTAGFNTLKNVVKSVSKATSDILKGVKTFSSVADDMIHSGKRLISSTSHAVKASLSKQSLSSSLQRLASKSTLKKTCIHVAKTAGKEMGKQLAKKAVIYGIDRALEAAIRAAFKKVLEGNITEAIKLNGQIETTLKQFVVNQVSTSALQAEIPSAFTFPEVTKKKMNDVVEQACCFVVTDITTNEKLDEAFEYIGKFKDPVLKLMEKAKVSGAVQAAVQYSTLLADCIKCLYTLTNASLVDDSIVSHMAERLDEIRGDKQLTYIDDARFSFPAVQEMTTELRVVVHNRLTNDLLEAFTEYFIALLHGVVSTAHTAAKKKINSLTEKAINSIMARVPVPCFFMDQTQTHAQRRSVAGEVALTSDSILEQRGSSVERLEDPDNLSVELQIHALAESPQLRGKGIRIQVLDATGKSISTEYFQGRESSTGDITLHLTHESQLKVSESSVLGMGKRSFSDSCFHFAQPAGAINRTQSANPDSLYNALAQASGYRKESDIRRHVEELRNQVQRQVSENVKVYAAMMRRQEDYERVSTGSGRYTIEGKLKRARVDPQKSTQVSETNNSTIITKSSFESTVNEAIHKLNLLEQETICVYNLGVAAEQSRMLKANTGQGSVRYLMQLASIPPYEALSKARDQAPGSKNPLLSTTVNDESGSTAMTMTTTNEHHQIAITTGDSMESLKARALITKELSHDNNESAMKLSMIAAHPMMSTLLREDAGKTPLDKEVLQLFAKVPEEDGFNRNVEVSSLDSEAGEAEAEQQVEESIPVITLENEQPGISELTESQIIFLVQDDLGNIIGSTTMSASGNTKTPNPEGEGSPSAATSPQTVQLPRSLSVPPSIFQTTLDSSQNIINTPHDSSDGIREQNLPHSPSITNNHPIAESPPPPVWPAPKVRRKNPQPQTPSTTATEAVLQQQKELLDCNKQQNNILLSVQQEFKQLNAEIGKLNIYFGQMCSSLESMATVLSVGNPTTHLQSTEKRMEASMGVLEDIREHLHQATTGFSAKSTTPPALFFSDASTASEQSSSEAASNRYLTPEPTPESCPVKSSGTDSSSDTQRKPRTKKFKSRGRLFH